MKTGLDTTICSLAIAATIANGQVVQWNIAKRVSEDRTLDRRQARTIQEVIGNDRTKGGYFATCKVGTPGQDVTLQLDTGSSDIWVPDSGANICSQSSNSEGCTLGSFNSADSSSFVDEGTGTFAISYVDGSSSRGDYFTDVFEIGDTAVTNMTMGLGLETNIPYGLVGVGYARNEASSSADEIYPNLPVQMKDLGLIPTVAYSLWLNDLDASTGNILFGGIDTKKYKGDLQRINIQKDPQTKDFTSFLVGLTSLQATSNSGNDGLTSQEFPIPVVLDSGTTLSFLPTDLTEQIWEEVGALYDSGLESAVVPCSRGTSQGHFSFGFGGPGGPVINVTMDELVMTLTSSGDAPQPTFPSGPYEGQEACLFGIQNMSSDPFLLGDTFLRSAYVVYDLVNNQIALAETDFNATESNVVPFASEGAPIPSATAAPNQDSSTQGGGAGSSSSAPTYGAKGGFKEDQQDDDSSSASSILGVPDWAVMMVVTGTSLLYTCTVGVGFLLQ